MNKRTEAFMLFYVNSIERWTGMKNTGLQIPQKDQVCVRFSYYFILLTCIGKSFSILCFKW